MFCSLFEHIKRGSRRCLDCARLAVAVLLLMTGAAAAQTVTVQATQHNMYQADVTLNDQLTASALIDTGATYLSLCGAAAKTLGLELGRSVVMRTANGDITSRLTVVRSVRIGAIEVRDIAAVVHPEDARCPDKILVGMSVLKHLHVTLNGNSMTLVARRGMQGPLPAWSPLWSLILAGLMTALVASLIGARSKGPSLHLRTGRYRRGRMVRMP